MDIEETNNSLQEQIVPEVQPTPEIKSKSKISINTFINIVLFIAVVILYVLHFTGNKNEQTINPSVKKLVDNNISIAFINTDSLMSTSEFVLFEKNRLEKRRTQLDNSLTSKQQAFMNEVNDFQAKIQKNQITQEKAAAKEQELMKKRQELEEMKYNLNDQLTKELTESDIKMHDTLISFLKKYNTKYKFNYILGYAKGSGILYANDNFDITSDVIKELNKNYSKNKKSQK